MLHVTWTVPLIVRESVTVAARNTGYALSRPTGIGSASRRRLNGIVELANGAAPLTSIGFATSVQERKVVETTVAARVATGTTFKKYFTVL